MHGDKPGLARRGVVLWHDLGAYCLLRKRVGVGVGACLGPVLGGVLSCVWYEACMKV